MKILFLDDDPVRHTVVKDQNWKLNDYHDITYVWNLKQFIEAAKNQKFDLFLLDHDLGGEADHYCEPYGITKEPNGTVCVKSYIEQVSKEYWPTRIVVHSFNGPGADEMVRLLIEQGIIADRSPFGRWKLTK